MPIRLTAAALAFSLASTAHAAPKSGPGPAHDRHSLDGSWTNMTLTGLDRPPDFKDLIVSKKAALAFEEAMNDPTAFEKYQAEMAKKSGRKAPDVGAFRSEWFDHIALAKLHGRYRSSAITFPKDGQFPYTKDAAVRLKATRKREMRAFDNPEDRPVEERCIIGPGEPLGPPMANAFMNADYVIVQTPAAIAIEAQMNHDVRIIRLNEKHGTIRQWMGDSIGHWQGNTLVVETTNFSEGEAYQKSPGGTYVLSDQAKVTEWFTRVSPTEILYRFKVEDPKTYKSAWKGDMTLNAIHRPMLEYACHEGNYALRGILAGARKVEAEGRTPEPLDGGDPPPKPKKAAATKAKKT